MVPVDHIKVGHNPVDRYLSAPQVNERHCKAKKRGR